MTTNGRQRVNFSGAVTSTLESLASLSSMLTTSKQVLSYDAVLQIIFFSALWPAVDVPRYRLSTYGGRPFVCAAAT